MGNFLSLFLQAALTPEVDALFAFLVAVSAFFTFLIFAAIFIFAIKYRRRSERELPRPVHGNMPLEIAWSVIPFGITMVMFVWGADLFFRESRPPDNATQIYVVGKQWMWKLQHMDGHREINELHVPVGRPVRLTMTSEDVIHSFFVPAFRVKEDVVPGRYSTLWFTPTIPGKYHLFCAEYCGTNHSRMIGSIYVMGPEEYQTWVSGGAPMGSLAEEGGKLFESLACANCHHLDGSGRCPTLVNIYGHQVELVTRQQGHGRRSLYPRVHPPAERQGGVRLPADHALVPGPGHGGRRGGADRIHQILEPKARHAVRHQRHRRRHGAPSVEHI